MLTTTEQSMNPPAVAGGRVTLEQASVTDDPSFTDPDTGLPSLLLFRDRLERAWITLSRTNGVLGVALIGLQGVGASREDAAPAIRQILAARARCAMREMDSLAFVEAGRMCLLIPQAHSLAGVQTAVTRLLDSMSGAIVLDGNAITPALQAGVSVGRPPDLSVHDVLRQAADALSWVIERDPAARVASYADTQPNRHGEHEHAAGSAVEEGSPAARGDGPCIDCLDPSARKSLGGVANWDEWVRRRSH